MPVPCAAVSEREELVRAAGGIVRRRGRYGTEVALIHRPRYDDWTFPKGKVDPGEDDVAAARREVREETGLDCELGGEVGETRYHDSKGRPKQVRYWLMDLPAGNPDPDFVANREVDELRWCTPDAAAELLTYPHDRKLLRTAAELLPVEPTPPPPPRTERR